MVGVEQTEDLAYDPRQPRQCDPPLSTRLAHHPGAADITELERAQVEDQWFEAPCRQRLSQGILKLVARRHVTLTRKSQHAGAPLVVAAHEQR